MHRLIGLDLSLTAPGLAWTHNTAGDYAPGCRTFRSKARGDERNWQIRGNIADISRGPARPDLAIIEGPVFGAKIAKYALETSELRGIVRLWLWSQRIPYILVNQATRCVYATGVGNATKDEVLQAIRAAYGAIFGGPAAITDDNSADAIALLAVGAHALGQPLVDGLPKTHTRAADTVRRLVPDHLMKELILR